MTNILILTPTENYEERWQSEFDYQCQALRAQGLSVAGTSWCAPSTLRGYDLILPLLAWGYMRDFARWNALLDRLEQEQCHVMNPLALLRWNSDKAYLRDLAQRGVAVLPLVETAALDETDIAEAHSRFESDILVIKPPISAGADGTYVLKRGDPIPSTARGNRRLIQPFLSAVQTEGEYSLLCFRGEASHCVVKHPRRGDFRVQEVFGGQTHLCDPPDGAVSLAKAAIAACPLEPLYARIDMVVGNDGKLGIMELELIEPSLYLAQAKDKGTAFASAIANYLRQC